MYRCVKSNSSSEVIAIGMDENQANQNYNDVGVWEDFTFSEIPLPTEEISNFVNTNDFRGSILKVEDNTIVLKTLQELQN